MHQCTNVKFKPVGMFVVSPALRASQTGAHMYIECLTLVFITRYVIIPARIEEETYTYMCAEHGCCRLERQRN